MGLNLILHIENLQKHIQGRLLEDFRSPEFFLIFWRTFVPQRTFVPRVFSHFLEDFRSPEDFSSPSFFSFFGGLLFPEFFLFFWRTFVPRVFFLFFGGLSFPEFFFIFWRTFVPQKTFIPRSRVFSLFLE